VSPNRRNKLAKNSLKNRIDLTMKHFSLLSNTDKMSDEEKIPIALAGLAGISLPFILGLIALYAAQG